MASRPVHVGHSDVDDDNIGTQLQGFFHALAAITGLATNFPAFMLFKERAQTSAYNLVIVCQKNSQLHKSALSKHR